MRWFFVIVSVVAVIVIAVGAAGDCPPCGDMQCLNDPTFPALRQQKKDRLTHAGFAQDRVALVDHDGACKLCLSNAPDWFSLLVRRPNGAIEIKTWTSEQEDFAKQDLRSGGATSAYVMYARERCACCGEKPASQRPDWDSTLQMSTSLAIKLSP
jgi:hypothetical protein